MPELAKHLPDEMKLRSAKVSVDRANQETLGVGLSEGTVNRIMVTAFGSGDKSRQITMAEKIFDSKTFEGNRKEAVKKILDNHAELKKRKFPTIPTMRIEAEDGETLYMTDLTRNGKSDVYSTPDWAKGEHGRKGKLEGSEKEIEIVNPDEISAAVAHLFEKSIKEGCKINYPDVLFLVVDKQTRKAQVLFGDILEIEFLDLTEADTETKENFASENYMNFGFFIDEINRHLTQRSLLKKHPTALLYRNFVSSLRSPGREAEK